MTSISTLSSNPMYLQQLMNTKPVNRSGDGDGDGGIEATSAKGSQGAGFAQSFKQAISQISSNGSAAQGLNAQAAIQNFMQQLLASIQQASTGQSNQTSQVDSDGDHDGSGAKAISSSGSTSGYSAAAKYGTSGQAGLPSLLQQMSNSSTANPALQQSFQTMLGAMGANQGTNTLHGFLQSLAADMQGGASLVSTMA